MNMQEVFDTAVAGVIKQGRPSVDRAGNCLYRGPDGLRCAVGWLIPDELYNPRMESINITAMIAGWPRVRNVLGEHSKLLYFLQQAHDSLIRFKHPSDFVIEFKRLAINVAESFELDPKVAR